MSKVLVDRELLRRISDFCNDNGGMSESLTDGYTGEKFTEFFVALYDVLKEPTEKSEPVFDEKAVLKHAEIIYSERMFDYADRYRLCGSYVAGAKWQHERERTGGVK